MILNKRPLNPRWRMPVDPQLIIPQTQRVPTPVPKPESPRSVAPPATVNNSRPRKVRRKQAKAPSDAVVNANTTPDQAGAIKHPDNLGRSQANGMVLDGQQVAMSTSAPKQNMHQPNGPWRGQAGDTAHASSTSEQSHAVNSVPTGSASKPSPRETAPHVPKPPSKLRLTIKPANAPQKQTNSATPGLMQPKAHEEDRNHVLPAPTFSYLPPPSALNHPHLPQPSRPMSSSSSSSSPSSSKPMMTRLPSINHLDVFHPPISHLHPLPAVSSMSSPMYLPPIASVAQPRRQPPIVTLPSPPPARDLSCLPRHPSPGHIPPNHMRFTAPLSTPPSFDAFARGAAPTAAKNPVRRTVPPGTHANPADGPTQSHQQSANGSPPTAPRKNILA
ncbi:uncharacterized protein PGTG_16186 [Puccinia graminis f. sp. tritici CRL 75-36-700-3]|uniref:Uncharacterized protein n=1 Tax=Puccinia graminis f. sp. tritici (strain CRL 75-36-700-3 / race SCCL) TaxID=418459 RepID=E3L0B9_PUCGT|nr:uncharacterized protein PGTG_16186 [Puccinia graminis f. sp. tritici CRL 75-36-700-3]EFP89898.2 hypothetical protein PGTG_16186 [Puccinia graminis f. sp. tritici CRL 75-36-700-3]